MNELGNVRRIRPASAGNWHVHLAQAIEDAISDGCPVVIEVTNETRKHFAESALRRMAPGNTLVTVEVA